MNEQMVVKTGYSACPHDCPSTCALEVEIIDGRSVGRLRGAKHNAYTDGVICAKVARYAERLNHPERLLRPQKRDGGKGGGAWREISWDNALDEIAEAFIRAEARHGSEAVWPYFYAGTMGLVQRDSIDRLRHAKGYSGFFGTICVHPAWTGYAAGAGAIRGADPREIGKSDCVVIWGTNPVSTQVNVMTHAIKARKQRGARIVAVDIYHNDTMKQADLALCVKPGTDGALACAVMHVLFRDGHADRQYLSEYSDKPEELESHLQPRTPEWAAGITGLSVAEIENFAQLIGENPRSYFRLGYGFCRQRNGAVNMHAASCIPVVSGAWQHEGGGAFHNNADIYALDQSLITGEAYRDPAIRHLEQTRIGAVLTGEADALRGGPPVTAMLVQNTNPASVAPEQAKVLTGLAREDLFLAVHEQFMTETAALADIVLPATMFLEHDDIYRGGGHQYLVFGPKLVDAPPLCRTNHFVIEELAKRLCVADKPGFGLSERQLIDRMLRGSGREDLAVLEQEKWLDCQPDFEESHFLNGFAWPDGKFRLKPDWQNVPWGRPPGDIGLHADAGDMPEFPDHWAVLEEPDADHPLRLATSPARSFLNSTFNETVSSRDREGRPHVMIHPDDAARLGIDDGALVRLINHRGSVMLWAALSDAVRPGVLIAEGLWPNDAHPGGRGINQLTSAEAVAPHGGAAFHDVRVHIDPVDGL